jgi:steroid delta-isomerase-like uncharacterized protein
LSIKKWKGMGNWLIENRLSQIVRYAPAHGAHQTQEGDITMSDQENIKAAQSWIDAWNKGDLSQSAPYEADNFMSENPGAAGPMNAVQNRALTQGFLTAFPESKIEVVHTIVQGDYVVTNWKSSGPNTGPLQTPSGATIPPTGKMVHFVGSTTAQVKNGKVVHGWTYYDLASLLGQLGLLPPM